MVMNKPDKNQSWNGGWLRSARRLDSPNFNQRPNECEIALIVLHSISLPPGNYGGGEVEALFTNSLDWDAHSYFQNIRGLKVSAHFFITRLGELIQFVDCHDRAWHAGVSSFKGRKNCNDYSIGIELEGLEGQGFEADQYSVLVRLCNALRERFPIESIVGHSHIAPGRKFDPGAGFSWADFQQMLNWGTKYFPETSDS